MPAELSIYKSIDFIFDFTCLVTQCYLTSRQHFLARFNAAFTLKRLANSSLERVSLSNPYRNKHYIMSIMQHSTNLSVECDNACNTNDCCKQGKSLLHTEILTIYYLVQELHEIYSLLGT